VSTISTNPTPQPGTPVETVLVVEDEILIRHVIADYLRECGYRVFEAVNADEAVAMIETPEISIDIVFSDVQMPGSMDGFALARWIRANKKGIQVILTSGVERSADIAATLCEAGPLLEKPYEPQGVIERIRQLTANAGAGQMQARGEKS
jgi:DNA-binding response OmpR family regulator